MVRPLPGGAPPERQSRPVITIAVRQTDPDGGISQSGSNVADRDRAEHPETDAHRTEYQVSGYVIIVEQAEDASYGA
jgi:hypothetical protein